MAHEQFFTLSDDAGSMPVPAAAAPVEPSGEADLLELIGRLRRAADREECLDLMVEALIALPGVDSVHVSLRDGHDMRSAAGEEDGLEQLDHVFVVRQGRDVPHVWPTTAHAWRPRAADRALHRALQTGRPWEGLIGVEPLPDRPVSAGAAGRDRRFAAAFPVLTDRGVIGQVLLTARRRFDDKDLAVAQTVAGAVGPALRPPRTGPQATLREEDLITSVARLLRAQPEAEVSLVSVALGDVDDASAGLREDRPRALRELRDDLLDQVRDWPNAHLLAGRTDELFVLVAGVPASEVAFRTAELRESARRQLPDVMSRWGAMTVTDVEDVAPHIRHTAAAFIELARATRDGEAGGGAVAGRSASGASSDRLVALVAEVLNELDAMVDSPVGDRLALVAARFCVLMSAAAWQVSQVCRGVARSVQLEIERSPSRSEDQSPLFGRIDFPIERRPAMARSAEGWAFHADLTRGDAAERLSLAVNGYGSVVCAGGYDPDARQWMVELFGDERSAVNDALAGTLLSLVQAALSFPRALATPLPTDGERDGVFG